MKTIGAEWDRYVLWLVLALPGAAASIELARGAYAGDLLHETGESSARLLIIALALTPLRSLFPNVRALAWMRRRRRDLGVAAFAYALLHTVLYLVDMETLANVLAEIGALGIWTGWAAFALFVPLAVTSSDAATRALGRGWPRLHRAVYAAALLTLLHWVYVHNNALAAWLHFAPLLALEVWRVWKALSRNASR